MTAPTLDPRTTPARGDIAARKLEGLVIADRYVDGAPHRVAVPVVPLRGQPADTARQLDELLFGETFTVYETKDAWAWGQLGAEGYVGYAAAAALDTTTLAATHRVSAVMAHIYTAPDLKSPVLHALSINSLVTVADQAEDNGFLALATGGWLFARHIKPIDEHERDFAAVAERLLGVPYLWGGRSAFGLDCSGLVQLVLSRAGLMAPRDSDMQAAAVGAALDEPFDFGALRRGDLVFFPGHAGIMTDSKTLLHAVAWEMSVVEQDLDYVIKRIAREYERPVTAIRRPGAVG